MVRRLTININKLHEFFKMKEESIISAPSSLKVLTEDGFKKVSHLYKTNKRSIIKITLKNGTELKGVFEHKIKTNNGYRNLDDIKIGDTVYLYENNKSTVKIKEYLNNKDFCYDLQIPENHNYITNNIISHNTEIFLAILKLLNEPTLVLFNRTQLTHQTMKRAKDRGIDAGIIQGKNVDEKFVTIATIQSIEKAEDIKRYKNLIIDEVHYASSKSYQRVLRLNHWRRIYGFSATPVDPEKMDLNSAKIIANVGPVIYSANTDQLIEKKIIAKPKIFMIKVDKPYNLEDSDYRTAELLGVVYNKQRNKLVKAIADMYSEDKVLILTKYVKQGEEIKKLILEAPFIWNKTKLEKRIEIVDQFDNGDNNVLIASRILDEGIDIKNFKILIVASAGNKFTKTIQRLGRGLRVTEDKKEVKVFDFIDDTHNTLYKHSKNRIKIYKSFGYDDITTLEDF